MDYDRIIPSDDVILDSLKVELVNPWAVSSLFEFSYFTCPECEVKSQRKQDFIDHVFLRYKINIDIFRYFPVAVSALVKFYTI
jgi:hypothetical protein